MRGPQHGRSCTHGSTRATPVVQLIAAEVELATGSVLVDVAALMELLPAQFPEEVREAAVDRFVLFASDELSSYGDDAGSEDEIYAIESVAAVLDTELDDQDREFARERMRERSSREDAMDDEDRYRWRGHDIGRLSNAGEMDALFSRLTE